jgi:hypothetical protein
MAEQLLSSQDQRVLCTVTHCPATPTHIPMWWMRCQHGIWSICWQMTCVNTFCNLFTTYLQLV